MAHLAPAAAYHADDACPLPARLPSCTIHQQLTCRLFGLPSEIRQRIYSYYLSFTPADLAAGETLRPTHTYLDEDESRPRHCRPLPALMLACRRGYAELAPLAHGAAAVRVQRRGAYEERRVGVAFHGVLWLWRLRRLVLVVEMEHANWNAWVPFFVGLVARAPALEHLVIDWAPWDAEIGAKKVGWQRRQHENKEDEFLRAVEGLRELKTVWLYGRGVPQGWRERIEKNTGAKVLKFRDRWWSEADMG
ncbi:hypothetical protein NKR19_g8984 [Coniochaeta hoffmannii]|uniref:F-box domain-containing protein n=1 Tax=Coniochaeta hoffmannii TaxID=91930 RepID=A0AA38RE25_9PEZI|nr:hypothetical protein NKR19_g8984 [Coniochaeta hoffmannii]